MAAANDGVVVWEYENDIPGLHSAYSDKVSNYIEEVYKEKGLKVSLKDIDTILENYEIDFTVMKQKSVNRYGRQRSVRRTIYASDSTFGKGIIWQWLTDIDWIVYDSESLEAIEDAYSQDKNTFDLEQLSTGLPNKVLLDKMYQVNKHSGFYRPIQRVDAEYTTLGGIKKKRNTETSTKRKRTSDVNSNSKASKNVTVDPSISKFFNLAVDVQKGDLCPICLIEYEDDDSPDDIIVELNKCKHTFHQDCAKLYADAQNLRTNCFIQCPECKLIHGEKLGNQPPGKMDVRIDQNMSVDGYAGCGMIVITYSFTSGIQGPNHPHPNRRYHPVGFPRTAYLPANDEGKKVLKLLQVAWKRNLIFTVGQSVTTGRDDCVIWNEIHHKTSPNDDGSGHGFPDPNYLDNVTMELRQHGVTENDIQ